MTIQAFPLFGPNNNPGPDTWVDALNQLIQWLNTNLVYNPISGGGKGPYRPINGSVIVNDIITAADFNGTIGWNSIANAGKLETFIAGPTGISVTLTLVDVAGTAGSLNIAVQGSGCTVNGAASHTGVDGDKGYITYTWDQISNWVASG